MSFPQTLVCRVIKIFSADKTRLLAVRFMVAIASVGVFLAASKNVSKDLTDSDKFVFRTVLAMEGDSIAPSDFRAQLELIRLVQRRVLEVAPGQDPIPLRSSREPIDLISAQSGLCYDRSRTIEKLLMWHGFDVRHVFILYHDVKHGVGKSNFWSALITAGNPSHAVTEVRTSKGWLLVDSNSDWIGLTVDSVPVSAARLLNGGLRFDSTPVYFTLQYTPVYGLYSRHGQFFEPHIPFPGVNWSDFVKALVDS